MPMTEKADSAINAILSQVSQSVCQLEGLINICLFLISNNFYVCGQAKDWSIMTAVLRSGIAARPLLASSSPHPTGTQAAILEKLFQSSVLWAARGDDDSLQLVQWLLKSGLDPNRNGDYPKADADYPLLIALEKSQTRLVKLLLEHGADANGITSFSDLTPLSAACKFGSHEVAKELVEMLILNGARPKEEDGTKIIPALHYAMRRGFLDIAELLLQNGANIHCLHEFDDIDEVLQHSSTALSEAAGFKTEVNTPEEIPGQGALSLVWFLLGRSTLLEAPGQLQSLNRSLITRDAVVAAACSGNNAVLQFFSKNGVFMDEHNDFGITPLCAAAFHGHVSTCALLLRLGVSTMPPSAAVPSALHLAAYGGYTHIIKLLESHNATANTSLDPGCPGYDHCHVIFCVSFGIEEATVESHHKTPLLSTLSERNINCAVHIIRMGVVPNREEFFVILKINKLRLITEALKAGADPNERDDRGLTALQFALTKGTLSITKCLLRHGAKLCGGELAQAFKLGDIDLVQTVLEHGAIAGASPFGETFLESAMCCSKMDVAKMALAMDNSYDGGALCGAVFFSTLDGNYSLVEAFLDRRPLGAPPDPLEGTAVSIAILLGSRYMLQILTTWLPVVEECKIPAQRGIHEYTQQDLFRRLQWIPQSQSTPLSSKGVPFWKDTNFVTASPLFVAVHQGNENIMRWLVQAGYQPDSFIISYAVFKNSKFLPDLLQSPAKMPPSLPCFAKDPAYWAVEIGEASILRLLQSTGQNICTNWEDEENTEEFYYARRRTTFQRAVEKGDEEVIEVLLEAGVNVKEPQIGIDGATCLEIAAGKGYIALAQRLIYLGADVNAPESTDGFRFKALEKAAAHGRNDMIQLLLNHCCKNKKNWKIYLLQAGAAAAFRGNYAILDTLRKEEAWGIIEEKKLRLMMENRSFKIDWEVDL